MTPAQRKTQAETLLTAANAGGSPGPTDADWLAIEANAVLSKALGTGTHYTSAEAALDAITNAAGQAHVTRLTLARRAVAHATLADR